MAWHKDDVVRVLVFTPDSQQAESCIADFRQLELSTRFTHVSTSSECTQKLSADWELLLFFEHNDTEALKTALSAIHDQSLDIPCIVFQQPDSALTPAMVFELGAKTIVHSNDHDSIQWVVKQQLDDLKVRRNYRKMSLALHESQRQRLALVDVQNESVLYLRGGIIQYVNKALLSLLGFDDDKALLGTTLTQWIEPEDQQHIEAFLASLEKSVQAFSVFQCVLVGVNDKRTEVKGLICPTSYNGEFAYNVTLSTDLKHGNEQQIKTLIATTEADMETGLMQHSAFVQLLNRSLARSLETEKSFAVACISVDFIKAVHEKLGMQESKSVLLFIRKQMVKHIRQPITHQGMFFYVYLDSAKKAELEQLAAGWLEWLTQLEFNGLPEAITPFYSVGLLIPGNTQTNSETLIAQTKQAAQQARLQRQNQTAFYQARKVSSVSKVQTQLLGMVSKAIASRKVSLRFQPMIPILSGNTHYYEASFDVESEQHEHHSSTALRSKLETHKLWSTLDRWQISALCENLKKKLNDGHDTRVFVQLGTQTHSDESFIPWLDSELKRTGVPANSLLFELSESTLATEQQQVNAFLTQLKSLGCSSVISDFGCGVEPLKHVENLPVDYIKFDPSFTHNIEQNDQRQALQEMIETLAAQGRKVVVPGISSAQQMVPIWQMKVHLVQGDFMQPPMESMAFDFEAM